MKIIHKIVFNTRRSDVLSDFDQLSVKNFIVDQLYICKVEETAKEWPIVKHIIDKHNLIDSVETTFTKKELLESQYLRMLPSWHSGYPQPEDDFRYLDEVYDLSNFCEACGVGKKQKAEFKMVKEPCWGKKAILQLNWVFDEYFVRSDVWDNVFRPLGIGKLDVLNSRTGDTLGSVVQLKIVNSVELDMQDCPYQLCDKCTRKRYFATGRGWSPSPAIPSTSHLLRSTQFFGDPGVAHNHILISNTLYRSILDARLTGSEFRACR